MGETSRYTDGKQKDSAEKFNMQCIKKMKYRAPTVKTEGPT
jgi:hypothetical protein